MKTFKLVISRTVEQMAVVKVKANSEDEAIDFVYDGISAGEYEDDFDWKDEQSEISCVFEVEE